MTVAKASPAAPPPVDAALAAVPVAAAPHSLSDLALKIALAGASNMTAACVSNPMDLVKVRQQLQFTTRSTSSSTAVRSTNWLRTMLDMIKHEGPTSLYKGLSASLLREGSYSGIRMGCYDLAKAGWLKALPWKADPNSFGVKLAAGMSSGMLGAAIANPADLLKVQMQRVGAEGSLSTQIARVYNLNGVKGFYRAIFPTTLRAGILTASQMGVYDEAKHVLIDDFPTVFTEGFKTHATASGVAGLACSAASSPVDVVKVRMMSDTTHQYRSAVHCAALMLKNEGPLAFYKGFTMCFLRLWPHSVVSLLVFEQLRKLGGLKPI